MPDVWKRLLGGLVAILAVAALALSAAALSRSSRATHQDTSSLVALRARVSTLETQVAALQSDAGSVGPLKSAVTKLLACMPEVMGSINGLNPQVSNGSVLLQQTAQISNYCSSLLYQGKP